MSKPKFEIGLVMAGAVSAGAYTAGMLDFMFHALSDWYTRHNGNPPHDVKIKVMTGASAGGMCSGISALQFLDKSDYAKPKTSKLYNSWVKMVDIAPMLGTADLANGKAYSLLDSGIIDDIADKAFQFSPDFSNMPPFVADDLHLVLTVTNTRGISYSVDFAGNDQVNPYIISNYGDFLHFALRKPGTVVQPFDELYDIPVVIDSNKPDLNDWSLLRELCKATGAFPLGLRARKMRQPVQRMYGLRYAPNEPVNVSPDAAFDFIAIDGGVVNNEPFGIGHDILAGGRNCSNRRAANEADRAVIMVDPFPSSPVSPDFNNGDDLLTIAGAFFKSLRGQALFRPDDLRNALNDNVYSRFLISPKRSDPRGSGKEKYHVAGGAIGAFSGFVHESYRAHDYQLGQRNAQHFFRTHFTLAGDNPLFANWTADKKRDVHAQYGSCLNPGELPIIPLPDSLWEEISTPSWPAISQDEFDKKIKGPMAARVKALGKVFLSGGILKTLWSLGGHRAISGKVVKAFENGLRDAELIR